MIYADEAHCFNVLKNVYIHVFKIAFIFHVLSLIETDTPFLVSVSMCLVNWCFDWKRLIEFSTKIWFVNLFGLHVMEF